MRMFSIAAFVLSAAMVAPAAAQDAYPTKPVRIVVGFPASGISDNLARVLAVSRMPERIAFRVDVSPTRCDS